MDLTLRRLDQRSTGIFSELMNDGGEEIAVSVERAYPAAADGTYAWEPKLPKGVYRCVRGQHVLHSGPIETFEITGVPGHTGMLFHPGNDEYASEGCCCLGTVRMGDRIFSSRAAFEKFMQIQNGLNEFQLTVE